MIELPKKILCLLQAELVAQGNSTEQMKPAKFSAEALSKKRDFGQIQYRCIASLYH